MSALGAPRAKLMVRSAIGASSIRAVPYCLSRRMEAAGEQATVACMPASLELVRIVLQAYGNGDCEIALALADPLIRWDERASRPDGDLVWQKKEVERAMRLYLDSWEEYRFDLEDIAEVGP